MIVEARYRSEDRLNSNSVGAVFVVSQHGIVRSWDLRYVENVLTAEFLCCDAGHLSGGQRTGPVEAYCRRNRYENCRKTEPFVEAACPGFILWRSVAAQRYIAGIAETERPGGTD